MNKEKKKPGFWRVYWWVAAGLTLLAVAALVWFWLFIDAYERSRPQFAVDAYISRATPEWISGSDTAIPADCDLYLQDADAARAVIAENVGTVTCLRDPKQSSEDKLVYAVMNGGRRIGFITLGAEKTDIFGFEHWQVTEETYDFSHLLGEAKSITVPRDYRVYANGVALHDDYITQRNIRFQVLEPYYDTYDAPTMLTYTTGRILGEMELNARDLNDGVVDMETAATLQTTFCNCSYEQVEALEKFGQTYVEYYVRFSSAWGGKSNRYYNHNKLASCIVPGSDLAARMKGAIDAIYWVGDHNAKIKSTTFNQLIRLEEGVYMCDLSYTVDQKIRGGRADSTVNLRLIVVETEKGLKAESMLVY